MSDEVHNRQKRKWPRIVLLSMGSLSVIGLLLYACWLHPQYWIEGYMEREISQGNIHQAICGKNYKEIYQDAPLALVMPYIDRAMEYGYYDEAAGFINHFLRQNSNELTEYESEKLQAYQTLIARGTKTEVNYKQMLVDRERSPYTVPDEKIVEKLNALLLDSDYDPSLLYQEMADMTDQDDQKIIYLEEAYRCDPNNMEAACQAAGLSWTNGYMTKARELLESAYQRQKDNFEVVRNLAMLELLDGNADKGYEYAKKAYDISPDGDYAADIYYIAMLESGRLEKTRENIYNIQFRYPYIRVDLIGHYIEGKTELKDIFTYE
ncbi:MAG: hypothetical protein Q4G60_15390 [bacterium]|nr:hypothetical protein [bacterium]